MATQDLSQKPYYDDYTPSKGYTHVAVQSGRVAQAREFNEIQSIMRDQVGRIGDALFKNGKIIDGCSILVNAAANTATISPGRIYLDGFVRILNSTATVSISGSGTEYIGARISPSIITASDDTSLLDPAVDFRNYGKIGADRIKEEIQFLVMTDATLANYTDAAKVATIVNGELQTDESSSSDSGSSTVVTVQTNAENIDEMISKRAFEENGSYKVSGLEVFDGGSSTTSGINVIVTDGKAYVNGYEVIKPTSSTLTIPFEKSTNTVLSEPKVFHSGTMDYALNTSPVKSLKRVVIVREVTETVTRGSVSNGKDALGNTNVVSIISVSDASNTYSENRDYQLSNNSIDWSPAAASGAIEPSIGATYTVTYRHYTNLSVGTDVSLVHNLNSDNEYVNSIRFLGSNVPADLTTFTVDYDYYIARIDSILMSQTGALSVVSGVPAPLGVAVCPKNTDKTVMEVGSVMVLPGYSSSTVDAELKNILASSSNNKKLSPAKVCNIQKRVDSMEYDEALSDLDKEAITGESASTLRGIFTDSFIGISKADTSNTNFNCTILPEKGELMLPMDYNEYKVVPNASSSSTNASKIGNFFMAPYSEEVGLSQLYATTELQLNPYSVYTNTPVITLSPNIDNFMAKNIYIQNDSAKRHHIHFTNWTETKNDSYEEKTGAVKNFASGGSFRELNGYTKTSTEANTAAILKEKTVSYFRTSQVTVTGSNFAANADNLVCTVNGVQVTLTGTSGTTAGTQSGTVKANAAGRFTATFNMPANIPSSAVEVKISNASNTARTIYYAGMGKTKNEQQMVNYSTSATDPVAQSFQFTSNTVLTKVGLFFSQKDTLKGVVVQVKDMVNGVPGKKIYEEIALAQSDILTSTDGTAETVVTFTRPIHCIANTPYCITILTDSASYKIWTAVVNEKDIRTQANVSSQPYTAGDLFDSPNNVAWTVHGTQDMKFKLYRARFNGAAGTLMFNSVSVSTMNQFVLFTNTDNFKNEGIDWEYRTSNDGDWIPFVDGVDQALSGVATSFQLKATIKSTALTSAVIDGNSVDLIAFKTGLTGSYISKKVVMNGSFNAVVVAFESTAQPEVQYSTDGTNWVTLSDPTVHTVDEQFNGYEYKGKLDTASNTYRVRINMTTENQMVSPHIRRLTNVLRSE